MLRNDGNDGISRRPNAIRTGLNSGYQALQIAIAAGAVRVILLGYDMHYPGGVSHWHGGHPEAAPGGTYETVYVKFFHELAPYLTAKGIDVINCSAISKIQCFRRMPLAEALAL